MDSGSTLPRQDTGYALGVLGRPPVRQHRRRRFRRAYRGAFATATRRGFAGYAGITLRALATYVPQHYRVTVDGVESTHRAILVTIANSAQFGNDARIAPRRAC